MRMLWIFPFLFSSALLTGCGSDMPGTGTSGSITTGTTPSAGHFSLAASETPTANVFTGTLADPTTWTWEVDHPVTISVTVGDNNNLKINGGTVYFSTDYGLLSALSCELVNGTCSITWYSEGSLNAPGDNYAVILAWMYGEEAYYDIDNSNNFSDGDIMATDTPEPFLDLNHNTTYDSGTDVHLDLDASGSYTTGDSLFNGLGCTHTTLCSSRTSIPIWDAYYLNLDARS